MPGSRVAGGGGRGFASNVSQLFSRAQVACERDPVPVEAGIALAHEELGGLYMDVGDLGEAVTEYDRAFDLRPEFADVRARLARALLQTGEVERAVQELT